MNSKADYVRGQAQERDHICHWPSCKVQVPPAMWGCPPHWYALPKAIRDRIFRAYRPGQEKDMRPSEAYVAAAREAQAWIETHYGQGSLPLGQKAPDKSGADVADEKRHAVECCIADGYLEVTGTDEAGRPIVRTTEKGRAFLNDYQRIMGPVPGALPWK